MNKKTLALFAAFISLASAAPSWKDAQDVWSNGVGSVFGSNVLLIGGFFLLFAVFIVYRMGLNAELAVPFGMAIVFILAIASPGLLPSWFWTVALLVAALWTYNAVKRIMGG